MATLVIRNESGEPIWADARISSDIMTLAPAHDLAAMNAALGEWTTNSSMMQSTSALPEWPANATGPENGEFPFYLNEGYTRESYEAMRTANDPMLCYVQGMESLSCVIYGDGGIRGYRLRSLGPQILADVLGHVLPVHPGTANSLLNLLFNRVGADRQQVQQVIGDVQQKLAVQRS